MRFPARAPRSPRASPARAALVAGAILAAALAAAAPRAPTPAAASPKAAAPKASAPETVVDPLAKLLDLRALWGSGVEAAIEGAYRACFRSRVIGGRLLRLRIPFAQNGERSDLAGAPIQVVGEGKGPVEDLWEAIEAVLASPGFASYVAALSTGRERLIAFDLEKRGWSANPDRFSIDRLKSGNYPGTPARPLVLSSGRGVGAAEVYDYLYCVGGIGIDCSGFVWHVLETVAREGGVDLGKSLLRATGAPTARDAGLFVGTAFFDPRNASYLETVDDRVDRLRPADVIVFRADDGETLHSAVIQSVDLKAGRIRYLQSTDEAPRPERGVHESLIEFDPRNPAARLSDPEVRWLQSRAPTFEGELISAYRDDGERYRSEIAAGRGSVVRLKALKPALLALAARKK